MFRDLGEDTVGGVWKEIWKMRLTSIEKRDRNWQSSELSGYKMRFLVGSKDSLAELSTSSPAMPQFKRGDSRGEPSHATVRVLELDEKGW